MFRMDSGFGSVLKDMFKSVLSFSFHLFPTQFSIIAPLHHCCANDGQFLQTDQM